MAPKKRGAKSAPATAKLTPAALAKIRMPHDEVVDLLSTGLPQPKPQFLGHALAVGIVCSAANTGPGNLPRTLSQLGVNGPAFQKSVFDGVSRAGYFIPIDQIPDAPTTMLITVVTVIQNAT